MAFIERVNALTRNRGRESLIVPTTFLTMHYFSSVRRYILDQCRIEILIHFKFPVFLDPTVESAIYICQKEPERNLRRENFVKGIVTSSLREFAAGQPQSVQIAQAQFDLTPGYDLNISLTGAQGDIILKMQHDGALRLGSLCEMTVGLKPYQTGKGKPKQTKEIVKQRVFDADHRKDKTYRQYLIGRDISRYVVDP